MGNLMAARKHNRNFIVKQCRSLKQAYEKHDLTEVRKIGRKLAPELRWAYFNAPDLDKYREVTSAREIMDQLFRAQYV